MIINAFQFALIVATLVAVILRHLIELSGGATNSKQNKFTGILGCLAAGSLLGGFITHQYF